VVKQRFFHLQQPLIIVMEQLMMLAFMEQHLALGLLEWLLQHLQPCNLQTWQHHPCFQR
jgi:hypothetical protein